MLQGRWLQKCIIIGMDTFRLIFRKYRWKMMEGRKKGNSESQEGFPAVVWPMHR